MQSLLVAFAKEIVDDQDLIETISQEHEKALAKIKAERRRSMRRRGSSRNLDVTDLAMSQGTVASNSSTSSSGGSSPYSDGKDDHVKAHKYVARSLRPRGSIYDRTGDVRLRLASMGVLPGDPARMSVQTPLTPGGTFNLAGRGNRGRASPSGSVDSWHSIAQFADKKVKWTFRVRVQIHAARNLTDAPRALNLRRGSMVGFGAGTNFMGNEYQARPTVVAQFADFFKYGEMLPLQRDDHHTEGIVHLGKNDKLDIPSHRTGTANGLDAPSWSEDSLEDQHKKNTKKKKAGSLNSDDSDLTPVKNLDNLYMTPALFEDIYDKRSHANGLEGDQSGGSVPAWLRLDSRFIRENGSGSKMSHTDGINKLRTAALASLKHARIVLTVKDAALDSGVVQVDDHSDASTHRSDDDEPAWKATKTSVIQKRKKRSSTMTTPAQAPDIGHRVTDDVTIGRVSLNVLELLAQHLPGGDGTRLIERGVKHQWVQLVQTKKITTSPKHDSEASAKNATGSGALGTDAAARRKARRQRRRTEKQKRRQKKLISKRNNLSSSAAILATSGNFSDFEDEDEDTAMGNEEDSLSEPSSDTESNESDGSAADSDTVAQNQGALIHKASGELCVSIVLVSEAEIISDGSTPEMMRTSLPGSPSARSDEGRSSVLKSSMVQHGVRRGFGQEDFHYAASRLRTVRKQLGIKPMELFATIDENRSGTIERQQFVEMMSRLCENNVTADESSLVFDHFDTNQSGEMEYNEFLKMMAAGEILSEVSVNYWRGGVAGQRLICVCVCLFVCLFVRLFCLFGWLVGWLVGWSVCLFVCLFVFLFKKKYDFVHTVPKLTMFYT